MERYMLDISPILLLSSGIVFLLVLARLNSCLYKPLFKHMDDRTKSIKKDLDNAKNNGSNIDGMLVEAKEIIAKAKGEAASIREKATTEAKALTQTKLADAKANLDAKYNDFIKSLEEDKESLRNSLIASMPVFKESLKLKISSI
jgi:F-type H+-transporting ATPase subunit b